MNPNSSSNPFNSNYEYACKNTSSYIDWNSRFKSRLNPSLCILDYKLQSGNQGKEPTDSSKPNPIRPNAKNNSYDTEYRNYLKKIFELFHMNGMTDNFENIDKKVPFNLIKPQFTYQQFKAIYFISNSWTNQHFLCMFWIQRTIRSWNQTSQRIQQLIFKRSRHQTAEPKLITTFWTTDRWQRKRVTPSRPRVPILRPIRGTNNSRIRRRLPKRICTRSWQRPRAHSPRGCDPRRPHRVEQRRLIGIWRFSWRSTVSGMDLRSIWSRWRLSILRSGSSRLKRCRVLRASAWRLSANVDCTRTNVISVSVSCLSINAHLFVKL